MITTKVGLTNSLKNLIWFNNVDKDTFFPKSFDLSEQEEREDFILEYKMLHAEGLLKKYLEGQNIALDKVKAALEVTNRRTKDLDDIIDETTHQKSVTENEWEVLCKEDSQTNDSLKSEAKGALEKLQSKCPQLSLNGKENIWIVKPAGLSRGRGITCYNQLRDILEHQEKEPQIVVQKYIENPLVISNKKFDIRQWVLVTDWNPITVWFYERCYLRFGVEDFELSDLSNRFKHLTNNSVVKYSENFETTEIKGSMWHSEDFGKYLQELVNFDIWEQEIKPQVKEIIKNSLECVQDMVNNQKNCAELYGYDIMIDENYRPWLIEVNCSPAMDYSTEVTHQLVKQVQEDCIKVMVDYRYAKTKSKVDTGNFSLLYRAKHAVERPLHAIGLNLVCEGKAIK